MSDYLKRLIMAGEENLPALIRKLKGQAPEIEQSLARKAPAIEGEVMGDLVPAAEKRILPDIEGSLAPKAAGLLTGGEEAMAAGINPASSIADDVVNQAKGLTTAQKVGAGLTAAAGAGTLYRMNQEPQDTTSFIDDGQATEPEIDSNDTIQNPINKKPEGKSASDYLALSKQPTSPEIPMAPQSEPERKPASDDFQKQLDEANQSDRDRNMIMGFLKAAQEGGSAAAGSKANTSYADTQLAKPNQSIEHLKANMALIQEHSKMREEKEQQDPASKISRLYQDTLKKLNPGMDVSNLSAFQVQKAFPSIAAAINRQDLISMHRDDNEQKSLDRQALMETKKQASIEKADEKDKAALVKAQKEMDEQRATRGTPLGREVMRYNGGLHAKAIIDKYRGHENDMPNVVKKELAVALASMVSPGLPHDTTIGAMDLKTFQGDVGDVISKVTGVPYGGKAGGFVKFMDGMIDNQMNTAKNIIKKQQSKQLAVYKNSFSNPHTYELLEGLYQDKEDLATPPVGAETDRISTTINGGLNKQDPQITHYAQQYGLDYAHAKAIIDARQKAKMGQ